MFNYFNIRNKETTELKQQESWTVSWQSRYGEYSGNTSKEFKVFPSKEDALEFEDALNYAHKLLKNTSGTAVKMYKND